jgi:hypothetical protein
VIGRATDVEGIAVSGGAWGTIGVAVTNLDTVVYLLEFDAPFPDAGTITLGSETGVTYTSRERGTRRGITYLRLNGLTRGAPVSQASGLGVVLTSVIYRYLVAYGVGEITSVRLDDAIQASAYTTLRGTGGPTGQPVTYVTFGG